jgi:hypothetical protein
MARSAVLGIEMLSARAVRPLVRTISASDLMYLKSAKSVLFPRPELFPPGPIEEPLPSTTKEAVTLADEISS